MPVESDADRAIFVGAAEFGRAVTWDRAGSFSTFDAQFSRPTVPVEGADFDLLDRDARIVCREADLPAGADEGDGITVDGIAQAYAAKALRPDGTGFVVVDLKKA